VGATWSVSGGALSARNASKTPNPPPLTMLSFLSRFALAAGLVVGAASTAQAQVCAPDNLDGSACCAPALLNLPAFPQMPGQNGLWICFDNCQPALQKQFCVALGKPQPILGGGGQICGEYNIRFQLRDCGTGLMHWTGGMRATYSRNWLESQGAAGTTPNLTVYRFIVNGDLVPTINVPNNACERPASLNVYSRVYFSGHVDYALDCATNQWSVAWAINHECDQVHHTAASARPAPAIGFDPAKSYSFVGPAAGFVVAPNNTLVSNGPITQGSIRWNNWGALPAICTLRQKAQGNFQANATFCLCGNTTAASPQNVDTTITAQSVCGSSVNNFAGMRFTQKRIGVWTNPNVFPGVEHLLFDFGDQTYVNGCTGTTSVEWFEGSETIGGYPAFDFNLNPLGRQFEDLGSCNTSPSNPARRIGAPHIVNAILNFNLP